MPTTKAKAPANKTDPTDVFTKDTKQEPAVSRKVQPLNPLRVMSSREGRKDYEIKAPTGTLRSDVLRPEFWSNVAPKITDRGSEFRIIPDDFSWIMYAVVIGRGEHYIKLHELNYVELESPLTDRDIVHGVEVKFVNTQEMYCLIDVENGGTIERQIQTRKEAHSRRVDYLEAKGF